MYIPYKDYLGTPNIPWEGHLGHIPGSSNCATCLNVYPKNTAKRHTFCTVRRYEYPGFQWCSWGDFKMFHDVSFTTQPKGKHVAQLEDPGAHLHWDDLRMLPFATGDHWEGRVVHLADRARAQLVDRDREASHRRLKLLHSGADRYHPPLHPETFLVYN